MRAKIEALTRYEHLAKDDPYRYGYERCKADVLALLGEATEVNPCASIFDHQWLDPKCVECGCQSLVLQALPSPATGGEAVTELERLRAIVARLPHTKDGVPVVGDGMILYCPKGHEKKLYASDRRLYCTRGDCWDDGCPGDDGSGTGYAFSECYADRAALGAPQPTGPNSKGEE